ncbi:hypothetical protein EB796_008327 [Bugula neritina]|uniref:Uncharacterized protein n=1 Tax=Bugula neritina TaxID=10212 RepID=A0A7J7K413_BUGNE|nr:hypothetical protein EB796_008327 [Bugula neritina]
MYVSISNWSAVLMATIRLLVVTFSLKAAINICQCQKSESVYIGLIYLLCIGLQLLYYPILVGILPMAVCLVLTVMLLIQFGRAHAKAKEILIQSVIYVSN